MLRPGLKFSGEVEEYMREIGWDRYRGWVAIYADELGPIRVYVSEGDVLDPPAVPLDNLQGYLVLFRRWSKNRVLWIDGYDEYELIGYDQRRTGKMLTDERFREVQATMHKEFDKWVTSGN